MLDAGLVEKFALETFALRTAAVSITAVGNVAWGGAELARLAQFMLHCTCGSDANGLVCRCAFVA